MIFPFKTLLGVQRVLTEANGFEWMVSRWMWEGLRKDKGVETKYFKKGTYDHPTPTIELRPMNPNDKDSPLQTVVTAINPKTVYDTEFTKDNWDKILPERSAPKDEKHINMTLVKIGPGTRVGSPYQVTDQDQFLKDWGFIEKKGNENSYFSLSFS